MAEVFREISYPDDPLAERAADLVFREVLSSSWITEDSAGIYSTMVEDFKNFCLEDAGKLVGVGSLNLKNLDQGIGELRNIAVVPGRQGTGAGRKLITALEAEAQGAGVELLRLCSLEAAIPFYLHLGYQAIGTSKEDLGKLLV